MNCIANRLVNAGHFIKMPVRVDLANEAPEFFPFCTAPEGLSICSKNKKMVIISSNKARAMIYKPPLNSGIVLHAVFDVNTNFGSLSIRPVTIKTDRITGKILAVWAGIKIRLKYITVSVVKQ